MAVASIQQVEPRFTRERPWEKAEHELRDVPRRIARERVATMGWE